MTDPSHIKNEIEATATKGYGLYKSATDLIQSHPKLTFWLFLLVWLATILALIKL